MLSAIVLSPNKYNYRKVAQQHWGLTDEQMEGMQVHHFPPVNEGGRNVPEHLYVCSPQMHQKGWHNDEFYVIQASKTSGNKHGKRGKPPNKTEPTFRDIEIYNLRKQGLSSTKIAEILQISRDMAKNGYSWCVKLGYPKLPNPKTGPGKGSPQRGGNPAGINQHTKSLQNHTEGYNTCVGGDPSARIPAPESYSAHVIL